MWNKKYSDRLLKLASFLKTVPKEKFNYANIYRVNCKTTACALGYCPTVFKNDWRVEKEPFEIDDKGIKFFGVELKTCSQGDSFDDAAQYFCINGEDSSALFARFESYGGTYNLPRIGPRATAKTVAKNIRLFVNRKIKEENV